MIWARYKNNPDFDMLHQVVKKELRPWMKDDGTHERLQIPHITLAKFKPAKIDTSIALNLFEKKSAPSIVVDRAELWESTLRSSGAEYSTIEYFKFMP
ncbi:MAG TPA: hypothetical protein VEA37_13120 [Flavobacterium sp.]|nr:hypothetical protein [Flavobacterium sp.]